MKAPSESRHIPTEETQALLEPTLFAGWNRVFLKRPGNTNVIAMQGQYNLYRVYYASGEAP